MGHIGQANNWGLDQQSLFVCCLCRAELKSSRSRVEKSSQPPLSWARQFSSGPKLAFTTLQSKIPPSPQTHLLQRQFREDLSFLKQSLEGLIHHPRQFTKSLLTSSPIESSLWEEVMKFYSLISRLFPESYPASWSFYPLWLMGVFGMGASRGDKCRHRELSWVRWEPKCPKIRAEAPLTHLIMCI